MPVPEHIGRASGGLKPPAGNAPFRPYGRGLFHRIAKAPPRKAEAHRLPRDRSGRQDGCRLLHDDGICCCNYEPVGEARFGCQTRRVFRRLIPDPFLLFLVGTVLLATFLPARGGFATGVGWLSLATILLLFFFHGAKLAREQIVSGLTHWRLHLTILACTFVFFPIVGMLGFAAWPSLMPHDLWIGILFVCALPSTVQSAIAFVSIARGNVPAAVASASASQMLGVVLTPILMGLMVGAHGASAGLQGMGKIAAEILLPFVVGHLMRPWIGGWVER